MLQQRIPILYEDESVLAINKPSGLAVHPDGRTEEYTLTDWVREHHPYMVGVGEPLKLQSGEMIDRPGIVHRIDRETSGVLLLAKTQEAHAVLKSQFQNRTIEKTYNCFVYGAPKDDEGEINRPIGRSKKDFRLWSAQRGAKGTMREAVTLWHVLERGDIGGERYAYLEVKPKTGRTHQIRVHLKAINYPIVCDRLYAPKRPCALGFSRLALHARSIVFEASNGETHKIEAPLPADFEAALRQMAELRV
jgi:23S rRNA pseudouridine1911/1915/1917 synthase